MKSRRTTTARDSSNPVRYVMIGLAGVALIAFLAALAQFHRLPHSAPPIIHVIMAIGIMPLIMGAMIYFTPVLTHSRTPSWPILLTPLLAFVAGTMATSSLLWHRDLISIPALLSIVTAGAVLGWMWHRAHTMFGRPHPGLNWYLWALTCLLLGLISIFIATRWPEYWVALKRFHLHINLLGFVGLTAFGTLRVLMPTVAGYADPGARQRLHKDIYPMLTGTVFIAAGSAWWIWLVWPGLVLWLYPLARFAWPLASTWRKFIWGWHRPATSLAFAVIGLSTVLVSGILHAVGVWSSGVTVSLFFFVFLFPLVTGAVSYLLPVWLWPERHAPAYETAARRLAWGSGLRALVFLAAGTMAGAHQPEAAYLAGTGVAVFVLPVAWAIWARFFSPI